jgi:hypothetical protein
VKRARAGVVSAAAAVLFLAAFAANVIENGQARARLRAGKAALVPQLDKALQPQVLKLFFDEDAEMVASDLRGIYDDDFGFLEQRVALWRWNLGFKVALPDDPARRARLAAASVRAAERCPKVARKLSEELESIFRDVDTDARLGMWSDRVCQRLHDVTALATPWAPARLSAWDWADRFGRIAAPLPTVGSPWAPAGAPSPSP